MAGGVLEYRVAVDELSRTGLKGFPYFAAPVVRHACHVHVVSDIDPDALLADGRTRITHRLRLQHDDLGYQLHVSVDEGFSLAAAVAGVFPHLAASPANFPGPDAA